MEKISNQDGFDQQNIAEAWDKDQRRGKVLGGIFIIAVGVLFLLREMGFWLPEWLFTWQMLVIAIGIFSGLKHSFRSFGWIITVLVGLAFMIKDFAPELHIGKFFWPGAIILVGIFMIFKPKRDHCEGRMKWRQYRRNRNNSSNNTNNEDSIEYNAIFGSIQKNVISKTFKGGDVNAVFGGAEINLMKSDFEGKIQLEVNAVFGGVRMIIPPNWTVKSEISAVMGSVEDNRPMASDAQPDPGKVLILEGNAVFGGIELQSY